MDFYVEQAVLDAGVKIVFAAVFGLDNHGEDPEWAACRDRRLEELYEAYAELDVHADPILEGFNLLHDKTGVKRRKNIPASENLIRLLKKNHGMFYINQAVDIYNLISLESKLALGAHNIDRVEGDVTLRFTDGSERFVPIGQSEPIPVAAHEYCYCDDSNEVLCRLEIRQVEKVNHPSLPGHPDHALYEKYFHNGGASIFTFDIKGGQKEAHAFIDALEIFSLLANVADVKSLVIHPATTTHSQLSDEELADQGIHRNTIRLSIGTEHIDDILADLEKGFAAVR